MGKCKKITEKVKLFYRGPTVKPIRVANQNENKIIISSFRECLPLRGKIFATEWRGEATKLRLIVGLSASLRALKQRKTKAIIYDDTAANHLTKYLNEFARLQGFPIIQALGLTERASEFNLTTLLVVSIVVAPDDEDKELVIGSNADFDKLCNLMLESVAIHEKPQQQENIEFKLPVLEKVPSSGKSREKKEARRAKAAADAKQQMHVGKKIKRVKMSKKQRHQGKAEKKKGKSK